MLEKVSPNDPLLAAFPVLPGWSHSRILNREDLRKTRQSNIASYLLFPSPLPEMSLWVHRVFSMISVLHMWEWEGALTRNLHTNREWSSLATKHTSLTTVVVFPSRSSRTLQESTDFYAAMPMIGPLVQPVKIKTVGVYLLKKSGHYYTHQPYQLTCFTTLGACSMTCLLSHPLSQSSMYSLLYREYSPLISFTKTYQHYTMNYLVKDDYRLCFALVLCVLPAKQVAVLQASLSLATCRLIVGIVKERKKERPQIPSSAQGWRNFSISDEILRCAKNETHLFLLLLSFFTLLNQLYNQCLLLMTLWSRQK